MIEFIFTVDYEIYGNGEGSLQELVYEPVERLRTIFKRWGARFVTFVEVVELERIEAQGADPAITSVKHQVRNLHKEGFELGLHLHPQWYNAQYQNRKWQLDYREYNLCALPQERIVQIVDRSIAYFRNVLGETDFTPFSFRAGNWLFQPTEPAASLLADRGIKVDSSVFKGGLQHQHGLDYRRSLKNDYYWAFSDRVDIHDPSGRLLELPTYTQMVPMWRMLTTKRIGLQRKGLAASRTRKERLYRLLDFLRLRHPLKLDFCRMTLNELTNMVDALIREDRQDPTVYRPIVAIGHTKDLVDYETVDSFLSYLNKRGILVTTFEKAYDKCISAARACSTSIALDHLSCA